MNILAKEGSEYYTLAEGVDTLLDNYTDSLSIIGELSTNNSRLSPEIKKMSLTAIGETPLQNNIESLDDIVGTHSKLSLASDRAVGEKSILIDHSASGRASYTIKGESFNGEKLPIITIWVKPLTDNALSFTIYNPATGRDEIIYSDSSGDGYFEIGEDLYKDQWNMVYLDLRDTNGSLKELREFKVEIPEYGTKVLIDGVNSLPLNKTVYQYDEVGNRDEVEANGSKMRYFYQPGTNLLDRRENKLERVEYQYDYEGNLISQDILDRVTGESFYFDYEYNELNQLVKIYRNGNNIDSLIAEYSYDHEGLRYKKVDYLTGKTTIYIYGQGTEPVYEEIYSNDDLSTPIEKNSYLFMGTKRIAKDSNGTISYYYTDHLGSTRAVDVSGEITRLDYAPFGEDFRPTAERYKFTGKEDDITTGLHYFNARYYDPAIGRFITEDPAKDGINWYVYCGNSPLRYVDPLGLAAGDIFDSEEEAAKDFANIYITEPESLKYNFEYFSYIYQDENKNYSYTEPQKGPHERSEWTPDRYDGDNRVVAEIHTHGRYRSYAKDLEFSNSDITRVNITKRPLYLANPAGELLLLHPKRYKVNNRFRDQEYLIETGLSRQSNVPEGLTGFRPYTYEKRSIWWRIRNFGRDPWVGKRKKL